MLANVMGSATRKLSRSIPPAMAIFLAANSVVAATHSPTTSQQLTDVLAGNTNPALAPGDTIILDAATTYEGSFTLRDLGAGTDYVTIQSSNLASLPATGTRVNLTHANNMPLIRPGNTTSPAFKTNPGAHHYKLIGLEITGPTADTQPDGITDISWAPVTLGTSGVDQDTEAEIPHHFVIDRCIVRANSDLQRIRRGIQINSASTDITNSYIAGFKDNDGNDTQAIMGWNGPGPFNIINNYLEAACENVMFGGSVPTVPNLVPSDIVIKKNHFFKPLSWNQHMPAEYGNVNWSIKNLFEIKNGRNVTFEGNILENHWVDSQSGWCIMLTPATGPNQAPWTVVENITFRNNIIRHAAAGPDVMGLDASGDTTVQSNHITFENNLFYDIGGSQWGGNGKLFLIIRKPNDVTINHNTAFHTSTAILFDGLKPNTGFVLNNNILNREGGYGIHGTGSSEGTDALNDYCTSPVVLANVLKGGNSSWYPSGNYFPNNWDFLVDKVGGDYENGDWDIDAGHSYQTAGTDGLPLGANIADIVEATAGCISGVWSSQPTTITLKNGVDGYSGATSFHVRGQNPTSHYGSARYYHETNNLAGTNGYVLRTFYKFDVSQAASGIPSGSTITSAKLRVKVELKPQTSDYGISCFRVAPHNGAFTVNYATATRNTYNGSNSWTGGANAGGDIADSDNDFIDTPIDNNSSIPAVGQWIEFDVASAVQAWVNGAANDGFLILTNSGANMVTVRLSTPADSHGSTEYPELEVTYE